MSGSFSDYAEAKILDQVFGASAWTAPSTLYAALYTANPSDSGGGTEVTGGSYARVAVTNNSTNFPAATGTSPTSKSNGTTIAFPTATADWGLVTAMAFYDAVSAGNEVVWSTLAASKQVYNGDTASFAASSVTITLD